MMIIFILFTLFIAFMIITVLYVKSKYIDYRVAQFDLDGDGIFSLTEQTEEMLYWFDKQISDGGLAFFLYYLLLPYSFCISIIICLIFFIIRLIIKKYKKSTVKKCRLRERI